MTPQLWNRLIIEELFVLQGEVRGQRTERLEHATKNNWTTESLCILLYGKKT